MTGETINLMEFVFGFSYTIALVTAISGLLYYRRNGKKTFFFTFVLVAAVVFQLCMMLVRIPMELLLFRKRSKVKVVVFKKMDLIHQDLRPQLIRDLEESFGINNIEKVQVGKIDTVKKPSPTQDILQ